MKKIIEKLKKVKVARCGMLNERCNFCTNQAVIDTQLKIGPFGYLCIEHIAPHAAPHWTTSARRIGPIPGVDETAVPKTKRQLERY